MTYPISIETVDPTNASVTLSYTTALVGNGDLVTAEKLVGWALEFSEKHTALLRRMSEIQVAAGDYRRAFDWIQLALEADPLDSLTYLYQASVLMKLGEH